MIAVVPPASVTRLAAVTTLERVVAPVLLSATAPSTFVPPTIPVAVMAPLPTFTVRFCGVALKESSVEPKLTALFVVAKIVFALSVTASL